MEPPGRKQRPKRRFMDLVREDADSWCESINSEDRERWRSMIHCSDFWKNLGKA